MVPRFWNFCALLQQCHRWRDYLLPTWTRKITCRHFKLFSEFKLVLTQLKLFSELKLVLTEPFWLCTLTRTQSKWFQDLEISVHCWNNAIDEEKIICYQLLKFGKQLTVIFRAQVGNRYPSLHLCRSQLWSHWNTTDSSYLCTKGWLSPPCGEINNKWMYTWELVYSLYSWH